MFQGYYNLTSGMLTETRNLNVISNNMVNVQTPGYKGQRHMSTTFGEEIMSRLGNVNKNATPIGDTAMIRASHETVTNYEQGGMEKTGGKLDFALETNGFFRIQTQDGEVYTRNGAFILDDEGYIALPRVGRVMGEDGPILLNKDEVLTVQDGTLFSDGQRLGVLAVVDFEDYTQLEKAGEGLYRPKQPEEGQAQIQPVPIQAIIKNEYVEGSNVDAYEEMTLMMESQRTLQSVAQVFKIYDQLMSKVSNDIGRV